MGVSSDCKIPDTPKIPPTFGDVLESYGICWDFDKLTSIKKPLNSRA
jgi:hypothetical protein